MTPQEGKTYFFVFSEENNTPAVTVDANRSAVDKEVKARTDRKLKVCRGEMQLAAKQMKVTPTKGKAPAQAKLEKALKGAGVTGFKEVVLLRGPDDGPDPAAAADAPKPAAVPPAAAADAPKPAAAAPGAPGKAAWQAARVTATNRVRRLQALLAKTKNPKAVAPVQLLENIIKRLAGDLSTKRAALDLAKYVTTDPDVIDLEALHRQGFACGIRTDLVNGLKALAVQLPA
jgi:hypothetical protein